MFPIISGDFLIIMIVIPDSFAFSKQHKKQSNPRWDARIGDTIWKRLFFVLFAERKTVWYYNHNN